jgi:hypothetical protein
MNETAPARTEFFSERDVRRSYGASVTDSSAMLATEQQAWIGKVRDQILTMARGGQAGAWWPNITVAANIIAGVTTEMTPSPHLRLEREGDTAVVRILWTGSDAEVGLDVFSPNRMRLRLKDAGAANVAIFRDLALDLSPLWLAIERISKRGSLRSSEIEESRAPSKLVQKITQLLQAQRKREAFDVLYREVHTYLNADNVQDVVILLRLAPQSGLPLNILVGLLTVTLHWRTTLGESRTALVEEVRRQALIAGGEGKAKALLEGLE